MKINKKMRKNGQAALEFLMTYAWAILIFLVAFAVILYYDPFELKNRLPEQAIFPPPLQVLDHGTGENGVITLHLKNNLDEPIRMSNNSLNCVGTKECEGVTCSTDEGLVDPMEEFTMTFNCIEGIGKRIDSYLSFKMNNTNNNVTHTMTGFVVLNMR